MSENRSIDGGSQGSGTAGGKKTLVDGNPRGRLAEAIALNRWAEERRRNLQIRASVEATRLGEQQPSITSPAPVAVDIGDIAVIQDTGDLVLPLNPFDVRSTGLRFTRNGSTYTLSKIDGTFRSNLGTRVTLTDDDSVQVAIPFCSRSTAPARPRRSSTRTAISHSSKRTRRAPNATSAGS